MPMYRHRVDCYAADGKFLGGAEYKTKRKMTAVRRTKLDLVSRLKAVVSNPEANDLTFAVNTKLKKGER